MVEDLPEESRWCSIEHVCQEWSTLSSRNDEILRIWELLLFHFTTNYNIDSLTQHWFLPDKVLMLPIRFQKQISGCFLIKTTMPCECKTCFHFPVTIIQITWQWHRVDRRPVYSLQCWVNQIAKRQWSDSNVCPTHWHFNALSWHIHVCKCLSPVLWRGEAPMSHPQHLVKTELHVWPELMSLKWRWPLLRIHTWRQLASTLVLTCHISYEFMTDYTVY